MMAYRRVSRVSWTAHGINASLLEEVQPRECLLTTAKRHKLQYFGHAWPHDVATTVFFGHVIRAGNLCTEILEGRIDGGTQGANRDRDEQTMSRTDQTEHWRSVHGW